jgi:hypothetical protein
MPEGERKPWALVAHKDGCWLAVAGVGLKGIGRDVASWLKLGCTITTVHDRDEYNALIDTLKPWPRAVKPQQPDLLSEMTDA